MTTVTYFLFEHESQNANQSICFEMFEQFSINVALVQLSDILIVIAQQLVDDVFLFHRILVCEISPHLYHIVLYKNLISNWTSVKTLQLRMF